MLDNRVDDGRVAFGTEESNKIPPEVDDVEAITR
jgi:hypothetical protein